MVECIFISYALNSSAHNFLVYKSEILDIHANMIIESRDVVFLKTSSSTNRKNNISVKRTHDIAFRDEAPSKLTVDAEVEPKG